MEDFVTVVSVGSQSAAENFVTVLSIGNGAGKKDEAAATRASADLTAPVKCHQRDDATTRPIKNSDVNLEEEVEIFRLPGERLGFGLKFEGGNKTSERIRRLFIQSCADQSPASRARCSWGTLGEGDEVVSIDGIPVTHMTRLDCVRRLKESQLMIKLTVRCRGALRPKVVSAERKPTSRSCQDLSDDVTIVGKIPPAPPPVPPRKLRQQPRGSADGEANPGPVKKYWPAPRPPNDSPNNGHCRVSYENCDIATKGKDFARVKQEPPEALVYLDARSHCGSTHGSTSDETSSSMSTVVDRLSTSDRVSTISTASNASSDQQQQQSDDIDERDRRMSADPFPFDRLDREFDVNPPDYLLHKLANSEAVTYVESHGEVERITAVVAPNKVLIEETITLQPPLSFQDAPLSYGHEARPDLIYAAEFDDGNSKTHFRPIKDDRSLVDRVNGDCVDLVSPKTLYDNNDDIDNVPPQYRQPPRLPPTAPPPLNRNHINRICVNQEQALPVAPTLPPKPLPRKDTKIKRKRPPPPPPPQHPPPPPPSYSPPLPPVRVEQTAIKIDEPVKELIRQTNTRSDEENNETKTNKVLEIIEIRKAKALSPSNVSFDSPIITNGRSDNNNVETLSHDELCANPHDVIVDEDKKLNEKNALDDFRNEKLTERPKISDENVFARKAEIEAKSTVVAEECNSDFDHVESIQVPTENEISKMNSEINEFNSTKEYESDRVSEENVTSDNDATSDESDGDYYWQSNLATIGEEEETNSIDYASANEDGDDSLARDNEKGTKSTIGTTFEKNFKTENMENAGDGQRLPPDGDEFPTTYQEFSEEPVQPYRFSSVIKLEEEIDETSCEQKESSVDEEDDHLIATSLKTVTCQIRQMETKRETTSVDISTAALPPLPASRPPKPPDFAASKQLESKKFPQNSETRRQDDRSERSVRDKIAMFSLSTSVDAPLFPASITSVAKKPLGKSRSVDESSEKTLNPLDQTSRNAPCGRISDAKSTQQSRLCAVKSVPDGHSAQESQPVPTNVASNASSDSEESRPWSSPTRGSLSSLSFNSKPDQPETDKGNFEHSVARANSLTSSLGRKTTDDIRRTSLNQLIEQRRKSISKLRGLVIPEKNSLPIDRPIIDLPEIKSRDSIIMQVAKTNLTDKWGSQSSIASNTSTASLPLKTNFKMESPQMNSKYSPAFKRKSLALHRPATSPTNGASSNKPFASNAVSTSPVQQTEPPKSLESICSPTKSDDSTFEFAMSASSSLDGSRTASKTTTRGNTRTEYDDSDNDSAVSSSRSSISRGFSPPASPVPTERPKVPARPLTLGETRSLEIVSAEQRISEHRNSHIPQRQTITRSNSTDTNSSGSSTLTAGSQASLGGTDSRRVLKPQSVEAINRKNILASARCRSGRDNSGSPLIQRKTVEEGRLNVQCKSETKPEIKVAYIETTEPTWPETETNKSEETMPKRVVSTSSLPRPPIKSDASPRAYEKLEDKTQPRKIVMTKSQSMSGIPNKLPDNRKYSQEKEIPTNASSRDHEDDLLSIFAMKSRCRSAIHIDEGTLGKSRSELCLENILVGKTNPPESTVENDEIPASSSTSERIPNDKKLAWVNECKDKRFVSKIPTLERTNTSESIESAEIAERHATSRIPTTRGMGRRSTSVTDVKKPLDRLESTTSPSVPINPPNNLPIQQTVHQLAVSHNRFLSLDSSVDGASCPPEVDSYKHRGDQFGSISSLASSTSLISQQELAQLVEDATLEETRSVHDVIVVILHKENPNGSIGITLGGGIDCEAKEISVHRVLSHSIADRDGRVQRGDRILSINGRSTRNLTHKESLTVLKQPRSEVVLVISRSRTDEPPKLKTQTDNAEPIAKVGFAPSEIQDIAWGPSVSVMVRKDGAGLGFSLEGGRDSPLGNRPLVIKKIFTGGAAEKSGVLKAGDQLLEVNGTDVTRMSRIEAWSLMKKLNDGEVNLLVRHPATKSS